MSGLFLVTVQTRGVVLADNAEDAKAAASEISRWETAEVDAKPYVGDVGWDSEPHALVYHANSGRVDITLRVAKEIAQRCKAEV